MKRLKEARWAPLWIGAAVAIGLFNTGAGLYAWWVSTWPWGLTDRLTAIADAFAFVALVDAAIAALVAVAAYYQATRKPDLWLLVGLSNEDPKQVALRGQIAPTFEFKRREATVQALEVIELRIWLENRNQYTARNPALRMYLDANGVNLASAGWGLPGWSVTPGGKSLQWDGGADLAVHGTWERPLPLLQLPAHGPTAQSPYVFRWELVADGFRRDFDLLIRFVAP
jgi:hypothetical protein